MLTRPRPRELGRIHINRGSILLDLGDIRGAIGAGREGLALFERTGVMEGSGRFILGNLAEALFFAGDWDEADAIAAAGLDHARRTGGHYHEPLFQFVQSELRLARGGDADDAAAAARLQIALARERLDDQVMFPTCSTAAWQLVRTSDAVAAAARRALRAAAREPHGRDGRLLDDVQRSASSGSGAPGRSSRSASQRARGSSGRLWRSTTAGSATPRRSCVRSASHSSRPRCGCSARASSARRRRPRCRRRARARAGAPGGRGSHRPAARADEERVSDEVGHRPALSALRSRSGGR